MAPKTGGWYVITFRAKPTDPFTVQVSQKPFPAGQALIDSGPYTTQALAQAAASKLRNAPVPGLINSNPIGGVTDFLGRLGEASTWIRVVEVLLGLGLIIVGLAQLSGAGSIATTAGKIAGKAALL